MQANPVAAGQSIGSQLVHIADEKVMPGSQGVATSKSRTHGRKGRAGEHWVADSDELPLTVAAPSPHTAGEATVGDRLRGSYPLPEAFQKFEGGPPCEDDFAFNLADMASEQVQAAATPAVGPHVQKVLDELHAHGEPFPLTKIADHGSYSQRRHEELVYAATLVLPEEGTHPPAGTWPLPRAPTAERDAASVLLGLRMGPHDSEAPEAGGTVGAEDADEPEGHAVHPALCCPTSPYTVVYDPGPSASQRFAALSQHRARAAVMRKGQTNVEQNVLQADLLDVHHCHVDPSEP